MIVLLKPSVIDPPAPRHAKVEDHRVAAIGIDQPVLRAAPEFRHLGTSKPLAEIVGEGVAQIGTARLHPGDPPPRENALQSANGRLDFGKLGHAPRYGGRGPSPLEPRAA